MMVASKVFTALLEVVVVSILYLIFSCSCTSKLKNFKEIPLQVGTIHLLGQHLGGHAALQGNSHKNELIKLSCLLLS